MSESNPRALVAMSGGVDSSVAALLLQKAGYEVGGATARLHGADPGADAAAVARQLGIPHTCFDLSPAFEAEVVAPFVETYRAGKTPNPCVRCNRAIKFGRLLDEALRSGYDYLATGHYVRTFRDEGSGRYLLSKAKDLSKDQSYVLYFLSQHQLAHTLFPLGALTKDEARAIARAHGLQSADRPESQDICFIPDGDYGAFLERYTGQPLPPGNFVDETGAVLGRHAGVARYTLGQRRGTGVASAGRLYVLAKDPALGTVTLGAEERLFSRRLTASGVSFIPFDRLSSPLRVLAKTRYSQREQPAVLEQTGEGAVAVTFDAPQRAITPGQSVVFYDGALVLGGGVID